MEFSRKLGLNKILLFILMLVVLITVVRGCLLDFKESKRLRSDVKESLKKKRKQYIQRKSVFKLKEKILTLKQKKK